MKKLQNFSLAAGIAFAIAGGGVAQAQVDATGTLPDAKPGECYAKVIIPAKYETQTEDVVVSEASKRIEVIPAKYETVQEKVMVQDASYNLIPVSPVYEKVSEKVEVTSANTHWTLTAKGKTPSRLCVFGFLRTTSWPAHRFCRAWSVFRRVL